MITPRRKGAKDAKSAKGNRMEVEYRMDLSVSISANMDGHTNLPLTPKNFVFRIPSRPLRPLRLCVEVLP
jgi:hypothetical protein